MTNFIKPKLLKKLSAVLFIGVLVTAFQNCNKVGFHSDANKSTDSSTSLGGANSVPKVKISSAAVLTGVLGGADIIPDNVLTDLSSPSIVWQPAEGAVKYRVSIYDSENAKVVCPEKSTEEVSAVYKEDEETDDDSDECSLVDKAEYVVRLFAVDSEGGELQSTPFKFSVSVGAKIDLPENQKVARCTSISAFEVKQAMPIAGRSDIAYAGDTATAVQLCKDLGCGDYIHRTDSEFYSPEDNSVARFVNEQYEIWKAEKFNTKLDFLLCAPANTVKVFADCGSGRCDTGKILSDGVVEVLDPSKDKLNADQVCKEKNYSAGGYGMWYRLGYLKYYLAADKDFFSWNSITNNWDQQSSCDNCLVSSEALCYIK